MSVRLCVKKSNNVHVCTHVMCTWVRSARRVRVRDATDVRPTTAGLRYNIQIISYRCFMEVFRYIICGNPRSQPPFVHRSHVVAPIRRSSRAAASRLSARYWRPVSNIARRLVGNVMTIEWQNTAHRSARRLQSCVHIVHYCNHSLVARFILPVRLIL